MTKPQATSPDKLAQRWLERIKDAQDKDCKDWYTQADTSYARYKNDDADAQKAGSRKNKRFNIYWSNIQVLKPALLSQGPKVNCSRRHKDKDPIGLMAAQILERATQFSIDDGSKFLDAAKAARDDYLLAARGTLWVRYEPTYGPEKADRVPVTLKPFQGYHGEDDKRYDKDTVLSDDMGDYVEGETYKPVVNERVDVLFVHYRDLVHGPASSWQLVPWVAARHHMRKRKLADRFGKACAAQIQQAKDDEQRKNPKNGAAARDTTPIWEIWDKERGQVRWVCEFYKDGFLDEIDDPLNLGDFFPCPRPLYGSLTPDSLIPTPDYEQYKDQALELDRLTDRALRIAKSIRVAGVYDGAVKELQKLFNESDGDNYVPVPTWAAFADKGGLKSAMDTLPLDEKVQALKAIYEVRQAAKADLYEVTGISDIMRGDTDPNETKGAQTLKANFGSKRLKERQAEVARFVRDTIALVAEVIAEHFRPEQIFKMAGAQTLADPNDPNSQQMVTAAIALLKDQGARDFQLDIETDSTVAIDEDAEKQTTVEFVTAVTQYLEQAGLILQTSPAMMPLLMEMLMFAVRRFKAGRDLEQTFEKAVDAVGQEQAQKAQQPAPPSPEDEKIKLMQAEGQQKAQEHQMDLQATQAKAQADSQQGQQALALKAQQGQQDLALKQRDHDHELQMREQEHLQKMQLQANEHAIKLEQLTQTHRSQLQIAQATHGQKMTESRNKAAQDRALSAQATGDKQAAPGADGIDDEPGWVDPLAESITQAAQAMRDSAEANAQATQEIAQAVLALASNASKPRRIVKGPNGEKRSEVVNA